MTWFSRLARQTAAPEPKLPKLKADPKLEPDPDGAET
jgi:hypothetical protein